MGLAGPYRDEQNAVPRLGLRRTDGDPLPIRRERARVALADADRGGPVRSTHIETAALFAVQLLGKLLKQQLAPVLREIDRPRRFVPSQVPLLRRAGDPAKHLVLA